MTGRSPSLRRRSAQVFNTLIICVFTLMIVAQTGHAQNAKESWWTNLQPKNAYKKMKVAAGYGPDRKIAEALFQEATDIAKLDGSPVERTSGRRKTLLEAATKFRRAAERWPDSALEEDAIYMAAECIYFADHYRQATKLYDQLVKKYPNSRHFDVIDRRRFQLAQYWLELHKESPRWPIVPNWSSDRPVFDTFGNSLKLFERIRLDDPGSRLSDDATMAAANASFEAEKYYRADELYEDLRKNFPKSEHQFAAHLLGLKCKLLVYQGAEYDDSPLEDAKQLLKQMQRQFPAESGKHAEYLTEIAKQVRLAEAERIFEDGKYEERRGNYAAAKRQYQQLHREFSDTSLSEEASEELQQLADKPDHAVSPAQWLTEYLPESGDRRPEPLLSRSPIDTILRR